MDIVNQTKLLMLSVGASPIMWLMIGLSVVSFTIIVERALYFRVASENFPRFVRTLSSSLRDGDMLSIENLLQHARSAEAEVVRAGFAEWNRGPRAVREALSSALAVQKNVLEKRLGLLGTLGNNAPFVGLLGTVIGIVLAFDELSRAGSGASATEGVMSSIAEALVATAIGLFVAIPAVAAFNWFQRKVRSISANSEALAHLLLVHLESDESSAPQGLTSEERRSAAREAGLTLCVGK